MFKQTWILCIVLTLLSSGLAFSKNQRTNFETELSQLRAMMPRFIQTKDTALAKKIIDKSIQIEKKYISEKDVSKAISLRIFVFRLSGKLSEVEKTSLHLLKKYPNSTAAGSVRHMRAWDIFNSRDFKRAVPKLRNALKFKQSDPTAEATSSLYLGWSLRELGKISEAKKYFLRVKEIARKNPKVSRLKKLTKDADNTLKLK